MDKAPFDFDVSKDLANGMVIGLIDRWLEYGYVTLLSHFAKSGMAFYNRHDGDKVDRVTVETEELNRDVPEYIFSIIRRNHDTDKWYKVRVRMDYHYRVQGVEIESAGYTVLDVAKNLHGVITSTMCGYNWDGQRRSIQEITAARTLCNI
jgi:hypothetical protein